MASRNDRNYGSYDRGARQSSRDLRGSRDAGRNSRDLRGSRSDRGDYGDRRSGSGRSGSGRASSDFSRDRSQGTSRVTSRRAGDVRSEARAQRVHSRNQSYLSKLFGLVVAVLVLAMAGVGVYFSNLFAIEEVTVEGVEHLTSEEMAQLAAVPSNTTLLRVDTGAIEQGVLRDSWVKSVDVHRDFPHTLRISVTERKMAATVEVSVKDGSATETWALAEDGMWLCRIPAEGSEESQRVSPVIYEDAKTALAVTDVAYGLTPEVGSICHDSAVKNALAIVTGLTTELKDQVRKVSASSADNATLTLESNVEIAFGTAEDIRDKERVCLQIMSENPDKVAYINVRVVSSPTWRSV